MKRIGPDEAGFVLPAVLAILVVIAAAAAAATQQMQTRTTITTSRLDGLRLQGLADGAARLVSTAILAERTRRLPGLALPENGTPIACPFPGGRLQIAIQDQAGLIDLNAAPRPLMEEAFRALGLPDREAATIAAEIVDARDPDDTPEPGGGAEAPQYKARGLPYGPPNVPYGSIDELDRLPSMTEAAAAILRPAVTVWNPDGGIDPAYSPAQALTRSVAGDGLRSHAKPSSHRSYEIRVVAEAASGARSGRAAVFSADGRGSGTGLLAWRAATDIAPAAQPHPACVTILAALDLR